MGKLQEFLMSNQDDIQATAEVAVSGFPVPFTIKSITEGENKAIRKSCQKITSARPSSGRGRSRR